jgi:hypothetical protein
MSMLYAIDPGTEQSAIVLIEDGRIEGRFGPNTKMLEWMRGFGGQGHLVIEQIASYGMPVGREVFETCVWTGRFLEAWETGAGTTTLLPRKDVKLTLCGSARAKDANVRRALLDRFGGKQKAVGTKKAPGPLYGIKSHCWAALALAVTYQEQAR